MTVLADTGITLRDSRPGEHRTACPYCVATKPRKGDDALAVRIEPDGSAKWLCHRCGWKGGVDADQQHYREHRPPPRPTAPEPDRKGAMSAAMAAWRASTPIEQGTVAAAYLTRRGCALPHPDGDLRFLASHRHPCGHVGPVLFALVTDATTAEPLTVHRTWLAPGGAGKAPIDKPRLLWAGLPSRGVVRLFPDEEITLGLCIAEGIETSLVAARAFGPAVWACLSAGNLAAFPVLDGIECLTIVADNDQPDSRGRRAGQDAADHCARSWHDAGREVRIWTAPTAGTDFADLAGAAC